MTNPEVSNKPTPSGGDYSEFYYLTKDGDLAKNMDEAYSFRLLEKSYKKGVIKTVYGLFDKDGR